MAPVARLDRSRYFPTNVVTVMLARLAVKLPPIRSACSRVLTDNGD